MHCLVSKPLQRCAATCTLAVLGTTQTADVPHCCWLLLLMHAQVCSTEQKSTQTFQQVGHGHACYSTAAKLENTTAKRLYRARVCCIRHCCAAADVQALLRGQRDEQPQLVLYCSQGGVLESTENHKRGWQTR